LLNLFDLMTFKIFFILILTLYIINFLKPERINAF